MSLKEVFVKFCNFGKRGATQTEMDGRTFVKLLKESKVMDNGLTTTDADMVFAKCSTKRKLDLKAFTGALKELAEKAEVEFDSMLDQIKACAGPGTGSATKTGKVARGLDTAHTATSANVKTIVDKEKQGLDGLLDRSEADVRGVKKGYDNSKLNRLGSVENPIPEARGGTDSEEETPRASEASKASNAGSMKAVFIKFCNFGKRGAQVKEMDGRSFVKLLKECKVLSTGLTTTDADMVFAKCSTKRKLTLKSFQSALKQLSEKPAATKSYEEMVEMILTCGGPGTGKATKTGKVARGLDTAHTATSANVKTLVDKEKQGLQGLLDRSDADVRGVKKGNENCQLDAEQEQPSHSIEISECDEPGHLSAMPAGDADKPKDSLDIPGKKKGKKRKKSAGKGKKGKSAAKQRKKSKMKKSRSKSKARKVSDFIRSASKKKPLKRKKSANRGRAGSTKSGKPLEKVYKAFCCFGKRNAPRSKADMVMDGRTLMKLLKESEIISGSNEEQKALQADADMIFAKQSRTSPKKKLTYKTFIAALRELAAREKFGMSYADMKRAILANGGPGTGSATKAGKVARGLDAKHTESSCQPKTLVDAEKQGLQGILDRSEADVRGIKVGFENSQADA